MSLDVCAAPLALSAPLASRAQGRQRPASLGCPSQPSPTPAPFLAANNNCFVSLLPHAGAREAVPYSVRACCGYVGLVCRGLVHFLCVWLSWSHVIRTRIKAGWKRQCILEEEGCALFLLSDTLIIDALSGLASPGSGSVASPLSFSFLLLPTTFFCTSRPHKQTPAGREPVQKTGGSGTSLFLLLHCFISLLALIRKDGSTQRLCSIRQTERTCVFWTVLPSCSNTARPDPCSVGCCAVHLR